MINFLILAGGLGWRIKSYEPRSILNISGKSLIQRQVEQIKKLNDSICLISGYKPAKIKRAISSLGIDNINNKNHASTNQIEGIRLFIEKYNPSNVFLMHGDLLFDTNFNLLDYSSSFLLYDKNNSFKQGEVGLNINDGYVNNLSYGLDTKWSQMCYLTGKELDLVKELCRTDNGYYLTFEVINYVINNGGKIRAVPFYGKIYELDTVEEIKNADFNC